MQIRKEQDKHGPKGLFRDNTAAACPHASQLALDRRIEGDIGLFCGHQLFDRIYSADALRGIEEPDLVCESLLFAARFTPVACGRSPQPAPSCSSIGIQKGAEPEFQLPCTKEGVAHGCGQAAHKSNRCQAWLSGRGRCRLPSKKKTLLKALMALGSRLSGHWPWSLQRHPSSLVGTIHP